MPTISINRKYRLTDDQYFKEETNKTQICLHHTVGAGFLSTISYWQSNPDRIATAYIVERDGMIYEVFDPLYWAHSLGLKLPKNVLYNQRCIGIELASEGALRSGNELNIKSNSTNFDTNYLYAFDIDVPPFKNAKKLYHMYNDKNKYFDCVLPFRDYSFFDIYDEPQVVATISLVNHLCEQFSIPKQLIPNNDKLAFMPSVLDTFSGIITHVNVRNDKSDLGPSFDWTKLQNSFT